MATRSAPVELDTRRAYEAAAKGDGRRILVDRLWPRGVSKDALAADAWVKAIAPSDGLRQWFGHDPARWEGFRERYFKELDANPEGLEALHYAADPNVPHTYSWFVMTDCNTPREQMLRDLTMEEAVRLYAASGRPEKRIGVTKDGIATVDLVHTGDGVQRFFADHETMDSFRNDPVIAEAAAQLRQRLAEPGMEFTMGGM